MRGRLAVFYRAVGGPGAVRLAACASHDSAHRLTLRQRLGFGDREALQQATFDGEVLALPAEIDCFDDRDLNDALYRWLAAYFAYVPATGSNRAMHPFHADVHFLTIAAATTRRLLNDWPGLARTSASLGAAVRAVRPQRALGGWEAGVEEAIRFLLGGSRPATRAGRQVMDAIDAPEPVTLPTPSGYRPFLPVPVWGRVVARGARRSTAADGNPGRPAAEADDRRLRAGRRKSDRAERRDSLILNRFEYLLSIAEMMNLNRSVEDDDPDSARRAAETVDEISLTDHPRNASSRLRLDLELAPPEKDTAPLTTETSYPEWDYSRQDYHEDHCRVVARTAPDDGDDWLPDREARRRIRHIRRQFEALRPRRRMLPGQGDGDDLDLAAVIRSQADRQSGLPGSERVFRKSHSVERDLSVTLLIDVSLSTDSYVDNRRVLDVEKEAVLSLIMGLEACGDDHAVLAFTSRTRKQVDVTTIKRFDEAVGPAVRRRLQGLKPGYYTRIGAAVRHATACLRDRGSRHRLLLVITDGKPNDMDHYEGRYGVEDTRRAVQEARREGLSVFGITVDRKARDYFPYLFGRGGFAIVRRVGKLPEALPIIYRQIAG